MGELMSNTVGKILGVKQKNLPKANILACKKGWNDVREGKSPNPFYVDNPDEFLAKNYADNRCRALDCQTKGMKLAAWNVDGHAPPKVRAQMARARSLGTEGGELMAVARGRMPENPNLFFA